MNKFRIIALTMTALLFSACLPQKPPTSGFVISQFTASYYDGSTFVATEMVDRPTIQYAWSNFHGIDSYDFNAVWEGTLDVDVEQLVDINFDVSWSDVVLSIDGAVVSAWSNSNRSIEYLFAPGTHDIVVEYANNWHTTGFNVSFTDNDPLLADEAIEYLTPLIDANTQVVYVGAYEADHLYNDILVTLQDTPDPVFLFLSSYAAVNWTINNPHDVTISGIAYNAWAPGATVTAPNDVSQFEILDLSYGYSDFGAPTADIVNMIGREPDHLIGAYALGEAIISSAP